MKTIEVIGLSTGDFHHVFSVFCEVDRGEDADGDIVLRFFVWGLENSGSFGVKYILIASYSNPDRALDLVEYFRAQLQDDE